MVDLEFKPGQVVEAGEGRQGTVRYIGELQIAAGNWLGLELPDASGKNDGSVKGERYFTCKPGHGIFVREESVTKIIKQAPSHAASKANGTANAPATGARSRPSSSITADVARRRQSLMSNGSGSAGGSRLSMRSPTKSPSKPTSTSASSATSTPRAVTPSTTTRKTEPVNKSRLSVSGRTSLGPSSATSRPTATAPRPSIGGSTNLRPTAAPRASLSSSRTSTIGARPIPHVRSASLQDKRVGKSTVEQEREQRLQHVRSPTIDEEIGEEHEAQEIPSIDGRLHENGDDLDNGQVSNGEPMSPEASSSAPKITPSIRTGNASSVESRTAQQREVEQLKAKIRTLEKKRQEDRDKLKDVEKLQSDKDRFEGIIQALQKKLRANQQELTETRSKYEDAEARANALPEISGEHESELELATLDKEMAEERAEACQLELDSLKIKHEELELEVEILREENTELSSSLSPEDKASAGWLQMQKETERLRDALLRLRDVARENESDLKAEVIELREDLDEAQKTAAMYSETAEKLSRAEETNKHLMGQLEAVETNDEIVERLGQQREEQLKSIEQLRNQIQDFEEHIQIADELESFHLDEEKRLHAQLDDSEALLNESNRRNGEQDRLIEELEYTLTGLGDIVRGLNNDIEQLRRSKDISELQAHEMNSKSQAVMDLNTRLSNNAAKTQLKFIDTETDKIKAELANKHVEILENFTHEMFDTEKKPVLTLLCFGRIRSKAGLVGNLLGERLRERSHLTNSDEIFTTFEVMEQMGWLSETCHRFEEYMHTCDVPRYTACGIALAELEPVEQAVTLWVEALKRDELARTETEHLKRMQNILTDLSEKLIADNTETKAVELGSEMALVRNYTESLTGQLASITRIIQTRLGKPSSEDEESLVFDKKMDQLTTKARTVKYLSGKISQQLHNLWNDSLCLGETSWGLFEDAEELAENLAKKVRDMGLKVAEELNELDTEKELSYASIPIIMTTALQDTSQRNGNSSDDPFTILSNELGSLHSLVENLQNKAFDLDNTIEFESLPTPWIVRAKEIKNTKTVSPEIQEELIRLERRNAELGNRIAERERTIEEMGMRVEIAEKRFKESKERHNKDKALQDELNSLQAEKQSNSRTITDLRNELTAAQSNAENTQAELETLRKATSAEALAKAAVASNINTSGTIDESLVKQFELEATLLQAEITNLQATVRYLREENRTIRIPTSEILITSAQNSWLSSSLNTRKPRPDPIKSKLERDGLDLYTDLIDIAKSIEPIRLSTRTPETNHSITTSWQPTSQTTRYISLKSREEFENWESSRADFINRAKIASSGARAWKSWNGAKKTSVPRADGSNLVTGGGGRSRTDTRPTKKYDGVSGGEVGSVRIVES